MKSRVNLRPTYHPGLPSASHRTGMQTANFVSGTYFTASSGDILLPTHALAANPCLVAKGSYAAARSAQD